MARRKKEKKSEEEKDLEELRLHPETKKSVWALILFGAALILFLARFHYAGPVGEFFYNFFEGLFGWGYYLLPVILLLMAGVFLTSQRQRIYAITFSGAVLFVLAGLGLIDIVFPEKGGLMGSMVGFLEIPFGYTASIIIVAIIAFAAFLITLNLPLRLPKKLFEPAAPVDELVIKEPEMLRSNIPEGSEIKEEVKEKTEETEVERLEEEIKQPFKEKKKVSSSYIAPPSDLLKFSVEKPVVGDLRASANIIKRTLDGFGIPVEMAEINIGPKVTRYTLKPAEGVKLSRITALNQDLALALASHPIRIEAPIPGKSLVGIEVPNKVSAIVRLGSLMNYPEFVGSGPLGFVLGRDVSGEPVFADISRMPHLLICGSTGSGKSIALHSLLISLLYKNSPQALKLVLIDPKRVELSVYDGLPHLVSPVITEAKKTLNVFRWAIEEMEKRYELLLGAGCRDISGYNKKYPQEPLAYILIVIDELADLMASYGREIEGSIVRLAQMARATGLHLIVATQRPSVEVITGLIKANITSRIALQVASQIDSRTILDSSGAEKLLGGGDMLFISAELSKPKRIQGAYVSEEEINKVVDFVRENNKELFGEEEFFENGKIDDSESRFFDQYEAGDEEDEFYPEAVAVVRAAQKASASLLQRRLKIGYARAARLLDIMEERGIIGPGEGAKPREVYLNKF